MTHGVGCSCERCIGIRRYPETRLCDWCHELHNGDANNCYQTEEIPLESFSDDTVEDEKLMWFVLGEIRKITTQIKELYMIPRSSNQPRDNQRQTRGTATPRTGLPYLNQKNMFEYLELNVKYPVRIIDCRVNSNPTGNQSPVVVKMTIKGKTVLWGLSVNNPSLEILTDMFGDNENDWADKPISMWLHEDEFDGRIWPAIGKTESVEEKKKK